MIAIIFSDKMHILVHGQAIFCDLNGSLVTAMAGPADGAGLVNENGLMLARPAFLPDGGVTPWLA